MERPRALAQPPKGRWIKNTRWSLLKAPAKQSIPQLALLGEVQQANKPMFRAFLGYGQHKPKRCNRAVDRSESPLFVDEE